MRLPRGGFGRILDMEELDRAKAKVLAGGEVTYDEAVALLKRAPKDALREAAHEITEHFKPSFFDFCAIVNARSGKCGENCKWCAQSAHWNTGCRTFGWIGTEACVKAMRDAEANGVARLGIVTAGKGQTPRQVDEICEALRAMRKASQIGLCASLGIVGEDDLRKLKDAGLQRLHCNLETAPSRFGSLCTTHTTREKLETIRAAKRVGLETCCGGIIGMGETDEELVEFAFAVKEVSPCSIPVNILDPVKGTPLGDRGFLGIDRILDSIAILRFVNPRTALRFAGGRRKLSDEDAARCIYVGISAGIQGPLLTTPGSDFADDRHLAAKAGYAMSNHKASS